MMVDILTLEGDTQPGEALVVPVMRGGKRTAPGPSLAQIRERAVRDLARLPVPIAQLQPGTHFTVAISDALESLVETMDAGRQSPRF